MSLFSSIAARIRSATRIVRLTQNKVTGKGISFSMSDPGNLQGRLSGLASVAAKGGLSDAILEEIAKTYVQELKLAASGIHSSGDLENSFSYQQSGDRSISVVSDSPYAMSWLPGGNEGRPPVSSLLDWMSSTSSFSGLDEKQMRRVAFAIQKASITKVGLGSTGLSRLSLAANGERVFDYRKMAHESVSRQVAMMGVPFQEVI